MGRLEVITGPMFSGKSEELMRRLRRSQIAGYKVGLFKPDIDHRYKREKVVSHNGTEMHAVLVKSESDLHIQAFGYDVIGVDEVQFIENVVQTIRDLAKNNIVIVSGLDMTYRAEPFGEMPTLLAIAERVDKYTAVCHSCGADATRTQRLLDGKPAPFSGPTVQVGGVESYEARCLKCFQSA